ncbi:MAG: hypothetical protein JNM94_17430 [Phycisphaerae bacterium]|nr:hypothetical protein [Phycisphaerae bacterium]
MSRKNARQRLSPTFLWVIASAASLAATSLLHAQFPELPSRPEKQPSKAPATTKPPTTKPPTTKPSNKPGSQPELWDPNDDNIDPKDPSNGAAGKGNGAKKPADSSTPNPNGDDAPTWSVLVASFAKEDHAEVARAMRERLAARYPQLRDAFVERVGGGSVVLVGRFKGPDDPAAQAKLKEVKAIVSEGRRPFAMAMLTRTSTDSEGAGTLDIRHLRERFPDVVPLYSLQVAAWSTFGDKGLSPSAIRTAAEKYGKELRAKGYEAWVHHDGTTNTSIVTVGHFDGNAYDSKSTLFAPEVEALMKRFPRHLLNGEEVLVPVDPRDPKGKTKPQGCRLVEVPR